LQLKVCSKLGVGAKPATPKNAGHSLHAFTPRNTATAAPQNQLRLANASQKKLLKNLHGGLRGEKRGWQLKLRSNLGLGAKPATPCLARIGSLRKSIAACRIHLQKNRPKFCTVGCEALRGVGT